MSNHSLEVSITQKTPLSDILKLAPACSCSACEHGCKFGSGILAGDDIQKLANYLGVSEAELKEKYLEEVVLFHTKQWRPKLLRKNKQPYGRCMFFDDEKKCTIHGAKPLQCKVAMGCKPYSEALMLWFMHNYLINKDEPQSVQEFEVYVKSGGKILSK